MNLSEDQTREPRALMQQVDAHARVKPSAWVFRFIQNSNLDTVDLTFGELRRRALRVAQALRRRHAEGNRVLLILPPGPDYIATFIGCLYAGAIAVPIYPPERRKAPVRFLAVARDAAARFVVAEPEARERVESLVGPAVLEALGTEWLSPDGEDGAPEDWELPYFDARTPAFLQYTSGSTSEPKGVVVTLGNLEHNFALLDPYWAVSRESGPALTWLPPFHDMGLIGNLLAAVHHGLPLVVMTPQAFGRDPLLWPRAMSHFGASSSVAPNFAYDLVASRATPELVATLDLKGWAIAMNGAEPILPGTLERFTRVFAPAGFKAQAHCPVYGLAEGTLVVSGKTLGETPVERHFDRTALANGRVKVAKAGPKALAMASSGEVLGDQRLVVVDPETRQPCVAGTVGELWLAGGSVARGYWGNRELTQEVFRATILPTGEGPFLRTGDLGFLHEGQLFVTGRLKDLIIIAGKNHYPQDLELTMRAAHPALATGAGAAFSIDGLWGEELALVNEVGLDYRNTDFAEVESAVRQAVAREHELAVAHCVFVKLATLPKTSSGKIRRHRCRAQFLANELKAHHHSGEPVVRPEVDRPEPAPLALPVTEQQRLMAVVARVLEIEVAELDPDRPLLEQGLSSLRAAELQEELQFGFGVSIDYEDFFEPWTVRRIAEIIATKRPPSAR